MDSPCDSESANTEQVAITSAYVVGQTEEYESTFKVELDWTERQAYAALTDVPYERRSVVMYANKIRYTSTGAEVKVRQQTTKLLYVRAEGAVIVPVARTYAKEFKLSARVSFRPDLAHETIERGIVVLDGRMRVSIELHHRLSKVMLVGEVEYDQNDPDVLAKEQRLVTVCFETAASLGFDWHRLSECIYRNFDVVQGAELDRIHSKAFTSLVDCDLSQTPRVVAKLDGTRGRFICNDGKSINFSNTNGHMQVLTLCRPCPFLAKYPRVIFQVEVLISKTHQVHFVIVDATVSYGGAQYCMANTMFCIGLCKSNDALFDLTAPIAYSAGNPVFLNYQRLHPHWRASPKPAAFPSWYETDGFILLFDNIMAKLKTPTVDVRLDGRGFMFDESDRLIGQTSVRTEPGIYETVLNETGSLVLLRRRTDRLHPCTVDEFNAAQAFVIRFLSE